MINALFLTFIVGALALPAQVDELVKPIVKKTQNTCLDGGAACAGLDCCFTFGNTDCCCPSGSHCAVHSGTSCGTVCAPGFEELVMSAPTVKGVAKPVEELVMSAPTATVKEAAPDALSKTGVAVAHQCDEQCHSSVSCPFGWHAVVTDPSCSTCGGLGCGFLCADSCYKCCTDSPAVSEVPGEATTPVKVAAPVALIAGEAKPIKPIVKKTQNTCLDGGAACAGLDCCFTFGNTDCCCPSGSHCAVHSGTSCGTVCAPGFEELVMSAPTVKGVAKPVVAKLMEKTMVA